MLLRNCSVFAHGTAWTIWHHLKPRAASKSWTVFKTSFAKRPASHLCAPREDSEFKPACLFSFFLLQSTSVSSDLQAALHDSCPGAELLPPTDPAENALPQRQQSDKQYISYWSWYVSLRVLKKVKFFRKDSDYLRLGSAEGVLLGMKRWISLCPGICWSHCYPEL